MIIAYVIALVLLTLFSFGFVDANFPTNFFPFVFGFIHNHRPYATGVYVVLMTFLFAFYFWILRQVQKKTLDSQKIWVLIFVTCAILFLSFPAFSYDIFNYIATAKVTYFYKENPYLVMPIEMPGEPMLFFLHAANKVALYGPTWIGLTYLPHVLGHGSFLVSVWTFKALIIIFYLGLCRLLWKLNGTRSLAFFALNPLIITETLVSAHNDVVMMFLALFGFWLAKQNRWWVGLLLLFLATLIKGATIVLIPIYFLLWRGSISWRNIWMWAATALLVVFFATPLREELYPWYFIWPLTFIAMLPNNHFLRYVSYGFSVGLPLRFAPFIYFGDWGGVVPLIKKLVSSIPPAISSFIYVAQKNH